MDKNNFFNIAILFSELKSNNIGNIENNTKYVLIVIRYTNKEMMIDLIKSLNYEFYDLKNLKKIFNIKKKIDKIKHGSSENILLM